jgi:hypothetical protein
MVETKLCRKCDTTKPLDDFHRDKRSRSGRTTYCKGCQVAKSRQWYADNPERAAAQTRLRVQRNPDVYRDQNYRLKYGITLAEYDSLLELQGGVCKICKHAEGRAATANLAVDHDHSTGEVRGLLCSNCNRALGLFEDSPELLQNAAAYLLRYQSGSNWRSETG